MYTISLIRRFIFSLPPNRIFTTREILNYGPRGAIDQGLWRLVKSGLLVRLARGVFIRENSKHPTAFEVAQAKYHAYGKQIAKYGADLAEEFDLGKNNNQQVVFTTTGRTSSFWFGNILIKIKGISQRKMHLNTNKVGQAIAALWYTGRDSDLHSRIAAATKAFTGLESRQLRQSCPLMPEWLSCFIVKTRAGRFIHPSKSTVLDTWSLSQVVSPTQLVFE